MKIAAEQIDVNCPESEIYNRLLVLDGKHILELGCGSAEITRNIATSGTDRKIIALEVDEVAHEKKLADNGFTQCVICSIRCAGYSA